MPFKYHVHDDEGIVEFIFSGDVSFEEMMDYRETAKRLTQELNLPRRMVDARRATSFAGGSTLNIYKFARSINDPDYTSTLNVAIVLPEDPQVVQDLEFLRNVELNRSIGAITLFKDYQEAWKFLIK